MPRKVSKYYKTAEKSSWEWTEKTDIDKISEENIETAYRLHLKTCKDCRRNCRSNPRCLTGLGEREWYDSESTVVGQDIVDSSCEKREEGSYAGLTNLGNTCYFNNFLQLWFHNVHFRNAIYKWNPLEDNQENFAVPEKEGQNTKEYEPKSSIGHLQLLFALLQNSKKKFIHPGSLIQFLGLDTSEQQDAHEFNNLFLSMIQNQLSSQSTAEVKGVIENQYSGSYDYVTKCQTCKTISLRSSSFYELDLNIKGHKELSECVLEFLKEEKLEGSDQYFCNSCNSKRNATRHIKLKQLPPVLNLQLLRFVFDRQSSRKKKINSFIKFPEVLDMSSHLQNGIPNVYYLSAVLMHVSSSADSGHYFSYIKDQVTLQWFKYNDEAVEKMDKLQLETEEEISGEFDNGQTKKPKVTKGIHASNSVYMLAYSRASPGSKISESKAVIPPKILDIVDQDNNEFLKRVDELEIMKSENLIKYEEKRKEIQKIYEHLKSYSLGDGVEFIPTEWLINWLNNKPALEIIDNAPFLCQHSKLNPDEIGNMKCVNSSTAEKLFEIYKGGPRLKDALCRECVKMHCEVLQMKAKSLRDNKNIASLLKEKLSSSSQFLNHKLKLLRTPELREQDYIVGEPEVDNSADGDDGTTDGIQTFNEDLLCEHGNFCVDNENRKLVSHEIWTILAFYFPDSQPYPEDSSVCCTCLDSEKESVLQKQKQIKYATEMKTLLADLYFDRNRPSWSNSEVEKVYIVSEDFVNALRQFIK
ncbi:Ubiquitin carboxyl-terminal hydrolase 48 [Nymphon striatum]|nr:Ubiquitin carboxyl-terminal hydrolase 48 [Nymphon striatum]